MRPLSFGRLLTRHQENQLLERFRAPFLFPAAASLPRIGCSEDSMCTGKKNKAPRVERAGEPCLVRSQWLVAITAFRRSQSDAAERFPGARRTNRNELVERTVRRGLRGADEIGNFHQSVGIGAVVTVQADRGGNRVDCGSVAVDHAGNVATSTRRGLNRCGIVWDAIRHAEIESVLDNVLALPCRPTRRCG